ncbi:MAG: alcohol dehydrogenase catalytic domain-containing protein [Nitrospirota bacterium]
MLANIIVKPCRIELQEIKTPKPSDGEILVKIKVALTCGTDLKAFLRGHPMIPMPGVFGHEFSGIIEDTGRGVKGFKKGDEVMAVHSAPCNNCMFCKKGFYNLCEHIMDTKILGAFSELILLPSHIVKQNVFHKPKNLSFEEAAFLEPLACVVHSIEPLDIKKGDSALIIGSGPIGLLHLIVLKRKKAKVAVNDINKERLEIAKRLGADFIFRTKHSPSPAPLLYEPWPSREGNNVGRPPLLSREGRINPPYSSPYLRGGGVGLHTSPLVGKNKPTLPSPLVGEGKGEGGFDYVFECTGKPEVWETSVNYLRRGGTLILFGGCEKGTKVTYDTYRLHYDEITLKGAFHYTPDDVKKAYKLLCEEKLGLSMLISGRYPLKDTHKAFDKLAKGVGLKYAIMP